MEPVSLIVGIVPLCAQLVKTTTTINNLIATYKSAAQELKALSTTLADVGNFCESLGVILSTTDTSDYHPSEARLFAALHRTIQECYNRLTDIHSIIQIANGKQRGLFRNEGILFLQYKDKISSCTKSLDKSLSRLQFFLAASNFMNLLQPSAMKTTIFEETNSPSRSSAVFAPDQASISGYVDTSPISTEVSRSPMNETTFDMKNWHHSFLGLAFITKTTRQKKAAHLDGSGYSVTEGQSTFIAGSLFFNRCIKVCFNEGCSSPLYITLQIPCVIPVHHGSSSLGERIRNAYIEDDSEEIRRLLGQRVVAPTTLLGWYDNYPDTGYSILGLAAVLRAPRILALARSQMTAVEERNHFPDRTGVFETMHTTKHSQCAVDYINMRKNGMRPDELRSLLTGVQTYGQFKACIDAYLVWSPPSRDNFYMVLGSYVLNFFAQSHLLKYDLEDWVSFMSEHMARGLDIYHDLHTDVDPDTSTLTAILCRPACSDVAVSNLHLWLDVLELAGVDIGQYLEVETPRCFSAWGEKQARYNRLGEYPDEGSLIHRVLRLQHSRGRHIPYWRDEIHSTCPLRELLIEFPRFLHPETNGTRVTAMDTMQLRQALKAEENRRLIESEKVSWPVAPVMADERQMIDPKLINGSAEWMNAMEWAYDQCYRRKARRERKLERKMAKKNGQKKSRRKIALPGSWVD